MKKFRGFVDSEFVKTCHEHFMQQLRSDFLVNFIATLFSQIMYCLCAKIHRRWRPFKIGDTRLIFAEKIHDGVFRLQSPTVPITLPNLRQTYQKFGKRHLAPRQLSGKLRFETKNHRHMKYEQSP